MHAASNSPGGGPTGQGRQAPRAANKGPKRAYSDNELLRRRLVRAVPVAYTGSPLAREGFSLRVKIGEQFEDLPFFSVYPLLGAPAKSIVNSWPEIWAIRTESDEAAKREAARPGKSLDPRLLGASVAMPLLAYSFRNDQPSGDYDVTGAGRDQRYYVIGRIERQYSKKKGPIRYGVLVFDIWPDHKFNIVDQLFYDRYLCMMDEMTEGSTIWSG